MTNRRAGAIATAGTATLKYRGPMIRILIASVAAAAALSAAPPLPASLQAMVDAERAFSRRAAEVGMRDSFLEFFADDAVRFDAAPGPAKVFLRRSEEHTSELQSP